MRCQHAMCAQPVIVIDTGLNREWCAARHRSDLSPFAARARRMQSGIEVITFVLAQAVMPTMRNATQAFVKLGRVWEKAQAGTR